MPIRFTTAARKYLLFTGLLFISYLLPAQKADMLITNEFNNIPIADALDILYKYHFSVLYHPERVKGLRTGTIEGKTIRVNVLIKKICIYNKLGYLVSDKSIIIKDQPDEVQKDSTPHSLVLTGIIKDQQGQPIQGASVRITGTKKGCISDNDGGFTLQVNQPFEIEVSYIGYESSRIAIAQSCHLDITLKEAPETYNTVFLQSGYHRVPEGETGSYQLLTDSQLQRNMASDNILDRIANITSGLLYTRNIPKASKANEATFSLRGRSTILSNPQPLIILDNFPYDGDISHINPNDIASITFLKDAAAAAIWGALSGNGVVVITTKTGGFQQKLKVEVRSSLTISPKPDLNYTPILSSRNYIDWEKQLYNNNQINYYADNYTAYSPVIETLAKRSKNEITETEANRVLDSLGNTDTRNDLKKYFYRTAFLQQYFIGVKGGSKNTKTYTGLSYDINTQNLRRNNNSRFTLVNNNSYYTSSRKTEASYNIYFYNNSTISNNDGGPIFSPYMKLADSKGNPLSYPLTYRQSFKDTAGLGMLLDWNYRPLQDLNASNDHTAAKDLRLNFSLKHTIKDFTASLAYQYNYSSALHKTLYSTDMYYTRNLINSYTQVDYGRNIIYRPIPNGDILDEYQYGYNSNNYRIMLAYSKQARKHKLDINMGTDIRYIKTNSESSRAYGVNSPIKNVNYTKTYKNIATGFMTTIPDQYSSYSQNNNFGSYYTDIQYNYNKKISISGSIRHDEANIFGADFNKKGTPLWSAGASWFLSKEDFFPKFFFQNLKLKGSYGYSGNVDPTLSAQTSVLLSGTTNRFGNPIASVSSLSNSNLGWEKIKIVNTGIEFSTLKHNISGGIELYQKKSTNLIGKSEIDPTLGASEYIGNVAGMTINGADFSISLVYLQKRKIKLVTDLLISFNQDKITVYKLNNGTTLDYMSNSELNPLPNYPLYSIFSYRMKGLDQNGNPLIQYNDRPSTDYHNITSSPDIKNLKYIGPAAPRRWFNLTHTLFWKNFSFSFQILYKGGYYFRKPSILYSELFQGINIGNSDYNKRWQKPGDENYTNVPSLVFPLNQERDAAFQYSDALVLKADHIRLQDIQLRYNIKNLTIATYASNLGILWRANNEHIDPDYVPNSYYRIYPIPINFTFSIKAIF